MVSTDSIADTMTAWTTLPAEEPWSVDSAAPLDTVAQAAENVLPDHLHELLPLAPSTTQSVVVLIALFIGLLCFFYVTLSRHKLLKHLARDFFMLKVRDSFFTEETSQSLNLFTLSALLLFTTSVGTLLYSLLFPRLLGDATQVYVISPAYCYAGALLFVAFHFVTLRYLSYVFAKGMEIATLFHKVYFTALLGMSLVFYPIALLLVFCHHELQAIAHDMAIAAAIAYFLLLIYQICKIFLRSWSDLFFIVLYLCILEILPLLVVAKWLL